MITLRKNPFSESSIQITFVENENGKQLVDRVLTSNGYELSPQILSHFQLLVNGHLVEPDLWAFVKIDIKDSVLIGPRISRGSGAQLFKQIAIITVAIVLTVATDGASSPLLAAAIVAGGTIGATLILNAIIPPPGLPGFGGLGGLGSSFEGSQMYTITGQTNNAKKFGYVPRVYGTHRIFPIIAANPYTEIEADPQTGNLVQFFYCIYDFGFGPVDITDIKIGDTSITEYGDSTYRLVDLNKPAVSEGYWDDALHDDFILYKGDVERDGSTVALDKNQSDSGAQLDDYQAIRNASSKVNGNDQEITLDFICPQGLIAYGTSGNSGSRTIDMEVEFSKVGEDIWRGYNDLDYVYDFSIAGGSTVYGDKPATVKEISSLGVGAEWSLLSSSTDNTWFWDQSTQSSDGISETTYTDHDHNPLTLKIKMVKAILENYGYPRGTTKIALLDGEANIRDAIYFRGNLMGKVASITASPYTGYSYYVFETPTTNSFVFYTIRKRYVESIDETGKFPVYNTYLYDGQFVSSSSLTDKVTVKYLSNGIARISASNANPNYATLKFKPRAISQFKIRIVRKNSFSSLTYRVVDKLTLVSISTRFNRDPILTTKRHAFLEVRIRATNQLNGAINNLSAVAESILDVYDPDTDTWSKQKTNNPAWVFCDLIIGTLNKRALSKDRLHLPSIVEWAEYCDEIPTPPPSQSFTTKRFTCNYVLDFDTTLQSMISAVCNAAQASLNIIDGKYGILIDKLKTVPVQIFTPRNSWGFSSTRTYSDSPHALKIRYIDPYKNWDISEAVVYDNGYDEDTATEFDELSSFACTNFEQAWRFGRYMLAQARLRKENITINVDFEHLVCTRGDFVQITQDVMRVGGRPARVKSVIGNVVKIDDSIDTIVDVDYGYTYRGVGGIETSTLTVIDSDEFELDGPLPDVGDLIIIGEVGSIVLDCLVKSIAPNSDLTAVIELVEKSDDVYIAESSDTLPDYDPKLTLNVDSELATPGVVEDLVVVDNDWRVKGGAYEYFISIDWEAPTGSAYELFEIYVDSGAGYNLIDYTTESFYEYIVDPRNLDIEHSFKVLAVSSTGKKLNLFEAPSVSATPLSKVTAPSDVTALYINITGEVIQLDWPGISDTDLREYLIRYSPKVTEATWESSIPLLRADKNTTLASTQGRTGTYFIKAVDLNGNESNLSAQALTSIPNLFDLNIIEETNDFPDLLGELDTTEKDTGALVLQRLVVGGVETNQYYSEGYYYYMDFLDLGEIYTVRLQSLIEAEGFTVGDLMSNWPDLSSLLAMSNAGQSEWDVETQYRATDSLNVISEWTQLSLINPLSEGAQDNWTPWKKFTIGDFTGRIFQFRLKLLNNIVSVTPRVFEGIIRADMPDRVLSVNNLIAPDTGLEYAYDPPFKGPGSTPNIQVTQDAAQSGDYYLFDYKTLDGFKIIFYDKNDVPVERQFDVAVKGYGRKALAVI
jgi:hypothetical protein